MGKLRKLTAVLLALALLGALIVPAQAGVDKGAKLVVLGDSIAAGVGASDEAHSYAQLLADQFGFQLSNFAVGGHASDDLLRILAEDEAAKQAIREADVINVSIGGNDLLAANVITLVLRMIFLKDASAADPYIEEFRGKFAQIIAQLKELNGGAMLIVQSLYNCMDGIPLVGEAYEMAVAKLNQVYKDYLAEHPGAFIFADVYSAYKGREGFVFRDRLHPSDAGHEEIARVLGAIMDGAPLQLEPAAVETPGCFQQIGIFCAALYDYLAYWLSVMSLKELIGNAISFI